jgi:hypothetical protein
MESLPALNEERDISIHREPALVLEEAKKAARALAEVIAGKKKPVIINGETYLEFEDWMTIARFYGITAKVLSTSPISFGDVQGFEARSVAILVSTGEEISAAEAMCLNDEANWKNRPLFMLRSMAQTRACAKALRNVLAWVVVLAGYKPTPAEEMEGVHPAKEPIQQPQEKPTDGGTRVITPAQAKRFYAIAKSTKSSDEEIKDWLARSYNLHSTKDIPVDLYDEICTRVVNELSTPGSEG